MKSIILTSNLGIFIEDLIGLNFYNEDQKRELTIQATFDVPPKKEVSFDYCIVIKVPGKGSKAIYKTESPTKRSEVMKKLKAELIAQKIYDIISINLED